MGKKAKVEMGVYPIGQRSSGRCSCEESSEQTRPQPGERQSSRIHLKRRHIYRPKAGLRHPQETRRESWKEALRLNNGLIEGKTGAYEGF